MINLLPDTRKEDIRAARANVILMRYTIMVALALAFLGGALYVSHSVLKQTLTANQATIAANDTKADVYAETKQEVDALSAKLTEAKSLLDQEISYSKFLIALGQITPAGTVLDNLTLSTDNFNGTPLAVTAYAKSADEASKLQSQFQNSQLFTQVNLQGTDANAGVDGYQVKVSLTVTINKAGF